MKKGLPGIFQMFVEHGELFGDQKQGVRDALGVDLLVIPAIQLNLPMKMVVEYNKMEETDPRFPFYYCHPLYGDEVQTFGLFLDKWDTAKDVICLLVWSKCDKVVICLPNVNLKPYPLCWNSSPRNEIGCQAFGEKACGNCGIARYCGKDCQVHDWNHHKEICSRWKSKPIANPSLVLPSVPTIRCATDKPESHGLISSSWCLKIDRFGVKAFRTFHIGSGESWIWWKFIAWLIQFLWSAQDFIAIDTCMFCNFFERTISASV